MIGRHVQFLKGLNIFTNNYSIDVKTSVEMLFSILKS